MVRPETSRSSEHLGAVLMAMVIKSKVRGHPETCQSLDHTVLALQRKGEMYNLPVSPLFRVSRGHTEAHLLKLYSVQEGKAAIPRYPVTWVGCKHLQALLPPLPFHRAKTEGDLPESSPQWELLQCAVDR